MRILSLTVLVCLFVVSGVSAKSYVVRQGAEPSASAQENAVRNEAASEIGVTYAARVARACLDGRWESAGCLKQVSESVLVMVSNYGGALKDKMKVAQADKVKEHCAAATAASKQDYPAYAMRSAFVECANALSDVAGAAGMMPDLTQYQILIGAVQCLDKGTACVAVEQGLARFR